MGKVYMITCLLSVFVCVTSIQRNRKPSIIREPCGYQMCIRLCKDFNQCRKPKYISTELRCVIEANGNMLESCDVIKNCQTPHIYSRTILTRTKGRRNVKQRVKNSDRNSSARTGKYFMTMSLKTWDDSLAYCQSKGGTLAMPKTKEDEQAILKLINRNVLPFVRPPIFFGLRDIYENGTFLWINGETPTFTNWVPGQPSHIQNDRPERCGCYRVHMGKRDGWTDDHCDMIAYFVCQKL